ncbi:MAG TPA: site-2 protease family protein [Acidimicrobiales bacterium]|nr:site-2 protease family protein [Acidimicrobiales bacterium]
MTQADHPDYYAPLPATAGGPAAGPYWTPPPANDPLGPGGGRTRPRRRGRVGSGLAALGAFLAKYGVLLAKLKYAGLIISMLVSVAAYALLWGWSFAAGFVALLFVHEAGHWVEMRRQRIPASKPMFIPFLGAIISMRGMPVNAYQEARVALAGPATGTAASVLVALWAAHTGSAFLQALAFVGFFLNLFNLLPALPLDGGRAVGALHPAIWLAGLAGLVAFELWRPSPVVPIIIILGGVELLRRWRNRNSPAARTYYSLTRSQRTAVAVAYLGLVALTIYGAHATYVLRHVG